LDNTGSAASNAAIRSSVKTIGITAPGSFVEIVQRGTLTQHRLRSEEVLVMTHQVILRLPVVKARTALSRSSIYKFIIAGQFPKSVRLGPRAVGWLESEIDEWIKARVVESRGSAT
jgi:prophage regulatory protein